MRALVIFAFLLSLVSCQPKTTASSRVKREKPLLSEQGSSVSSECEELASDSACALSGFIYQCTHTGKDNQTYTADSRQCEDKNKTIQRLYSMACNSSNLMNFKEFKTKVVCRELPKTKAPENKHPTRINTFTNTPTPTHTLTSTSTNTKCESLVSTTDCPLADIKYQCIYRGEDTDYIGQTEPCEDKNKTIQRIYSAACPLTDEIGSFNDFKQKVICQELLTPVDTEPSVSIGFECDKFIQTKDCPVSEIHYECTYVEKYDNTQYHSVKTGSCENKEKTIQRLYTVSCSDSNPVSFSEFKAAVVCEEINKVETTVPDTY